MISVDSDISCAPSAPRFASGASLMGAFCRGVLLCALAFALVAAVAPATSAFAASSGVYLATATPHYAHPHTGVIEDAGGNGSTTLGQAMTESATANTALVEVDSAGNTYATVRLQLMDNIENPSFTVDGYNTQVALMQEDYARNTADYRMLVRSESSVIRCSMYVTAMGRDVIFYITLSGLTPGSGDFVVSAPTAAAQGQAAVQAAAQGEGAMAGEAQAAADEAQATSADAADGAEALIADEAVPEAAGTEAGQGQADNVALWVVLDCLLAAAVIGAGAWLFLSHRKRALSGAGAGALADAGSSSANQATVKPSAKSDSEKAGDAR